MSDSAQESDVQNKIIEVKNEKQDSEQSTSDNNEASKSQDEMDTSENNMVSDENATVKEKSSVEKMDVEEGKVTETDEESQAEDVTEARETQKVLDDVFESKESIEEQVQVNSNSENVKKNADSKATKEDNDDAISNESADNIDENKDSSDSNKSKEDDTSEDAENLNNEQKEGKTEKMDCIEDKDTDEETMDEDVSTETHDVTTVNDTDEKVDIENKNKELSKENKESDKNEMNSDENKEEEKQNSDKDQEKTSEDEDGQSSEENTEKENACQYTEKVSENAGEDSVENKDKGISYRDEEKMSEDEDEDEKCNDENLEKEKENSNKVEEKARDDKDEMNNDEVQEKQITDEKSVGEIEEKGNSSKNEEKMSENEDEKNYDENIEKKKKNPDKTEEKTNDDRNKKSVDKVKEKENSRKDEEKISGDENQKSNDNNLEKDKENYDKDEEKMSEDERSDKGIKEKEKKNSDKAEKKISKDKHKKNDGIGQNENKNSAKNKEKTNEDNNEDQEKEKERSNKGEDIISEDKDKMSIDGNEEKEKENSDKGQDKNEKRGTYDEVNINMDIAENENENRELLPSSNESDKDANEEDVNKNNDNCNVPSINDENSIFVQVNNEKDDSEKCTTSAEQVSNDVDPIGSSDWSQNNENNENTFISDLDEADECIIPDTNRDESMSVDTVDTVELESTSNATSVATTSTESDRMKLSEKYLVSVANTEEQSKCMICKEKKVCKYNCSKDNDKTTICSEDCLSNLKEQHTDNVIVRQLRVKNFSLDKTLQTTDGQTAQTAKPTGNISCKNCTSVIRNVNSSLSWEALDFCNEQCLTKHQKLIGSFCANCRIEVKENFLGKYCVRFGYNVRQFCSSTCLEQYKKNSKVCSYCQDDISGNVSGFLTSIGDKGMSKDFCSAQCMQKYNEISKHLKGGKVYEKCCVCHKHNVIEVEFDYKNKNVLFCSEPCFVAFKYVNDVNPEKCDMCCKYYISQPTLNYLIRYDGVFRKFCQKTCQNIYITTNRKIVSCCWCKVKKYNFDMIQKYSPDNSVLIVCSLTCLNFFNASINVSKVKRKRCDFCHKICKGQYHITLADDSMKNFCSYPCVQEYQNKYILAPARYSEQPVAIASNSNVRVTRKSSSVASQRKQIIPDSPGPLPIITSVRSLAPVTNTSVSTRSLRSKSSAPNTIATITSLQTETPPVKRIIVLRPPEMTTQRNVATLVKPITSDVEVEFKPIMVDKAVQTEDIKDSLVLVPIPVPIYVPSPMQMFNLLFPKPIPFPLPIPVPMFVPITKQTANVILKEMKKNHKNTPTDPYEADLLMMAELVAVENEKKEPVSESDVEAESDGDNAGAEPSFSPEPQDGSNTFGEDMLQMALKMASDFEEPAVDLEGALTASTITATSAPNEQVDEVAPIQPPVERPTFRGRKRGRPARHAGRGRGRGRPPTQREIVIPVEPEPQPPPEPVEKPDANMCLKYTFGVNAWKQWVTTKNAELEKSSRLTKPFKPDLLQLTSDELNYSLCLFVKEVRKPNGAEYAPDTIYYLCLGIQQYLYENGRVDNIFCDSYYESFTDCLDEVCKKFSTLYNDSQYIVTRVEEEHLWESKQLGAHSPHVLLSTLMFFNTKHFNLTNVEEHMQLSFSHIMKHWKRVPNQPGTPKNSTSRNMQLRFYPPQSAVEGNNRKKKVYEQQENEENPLRCPVKLYEFYLSKCPESVKTRNDVFYLLPERSCVPDSPVWYSTMALGKEALEKMLHRVKMVKEINVALLAS